MTKDSDTQDVPPKDRSDLAGEYALGLMSAEDRAAFELDLNNNSALRQEVVLWQEHFAALGMEIEEVAPPAAVFTHLKRELWDENTLPWHRRIRLWEYALGGVTAALLAYAVYNASDLTMQNAPELQASIQSEQADVQVAFAYGEGSGLLRVEFSGTAPKEGRSYELWAIAEGAAPRSLGILPTERVAVLRLNDAQAELVRVGVTLALSDEPSGGSPTGAPTGAVLGAGAVSLLTNL